MPDVPVFFDTEYSPPGAGFDTHAKARLVADRVAGIPGAALTAPRPATWDEIAEIHAATYVEALRTGSPGDLASTNGFEWTDELMRSVLASTGGARDAALTALGTGGVAGSLSSGLHHAHFGEGQGYCTVNGLALAALAARRAGAARVLVLDVDAHCGGGTADIIRRHAGIEQVDVSVIRYDAYASDEVARLVIADGSDYLSTVRAELDRIVDPSSIDLVLHNAGMDPHESAGGVVGITTAVLAERERMVFEWAARHGLPVAFVLAGGYKSGRFTLDDVADLHAETIRAAVGTAR